MALGEKIKAAREAAGLTQDDLAYKLRSYPTLERVTSSLLSGWENDEVKRVSFPAVDAIAHATGKDLSYFSEARAVQSLEAASPNGTGALQPSTEERAAWMAGASRPRTVRRGTDRRTRRRRIDEDTA